MKKIGVEVKHHVVMYEANDGEKFSTESECRSYEDTAFCVTMSRINSMSRTKRTNEYDLFGFGSEEGYCYFVTPWTKEDVDCINQAIAYQNHDAYYEGRKLDDSCIGKNVIVTAYDGGYVSAFVVDKLIERMNKHFEHVTE